MISGLFRLLSRLLTVAVLVVIFTAVWIVYDGLNDSGSKADCAVVLGAGVEASGQPGSVLRQRLDRAVEVFRAGKVPVIIVSGADHEKGDGHSEAPAMAQYLTQHGVPTPAIVLDHGGTNTDATAHDVAAIMAARHAKSVMVVTSYYHITRTKMAFRREGVTELSQAHAGTVSKDDAFSIAREVADIYYHLFKYYLGPAAQKLTAQAAVEMQKLGSQMQSETQHIENQGQKNLKTK